MSRKIAIIGTAEPHWRHAPYSDKTWEIWTCGGIFATVPRTDRHIEIHVPEETCIGWGPSASPEQEAAARGVYWEWLAQQGPKAFLQQKYPQTPGASVYPLPEILEAFPTRYFTNTIAYMIALALLEGATEIGLWGVDMALAGDPVAGSDEYGQQRPSCEYFLGIAIGSGVNVHLPPQTTLLKARKLYGYASGEDKLMAAGKAKQQELDQRIQFALQQKALARQKLQEAEQLEAAMRCGKDIAGYFLRNMEY